MRLIDADALIDKCGGWYVEEGTESGFIGTLKNLLATMPTIQPEKRTEERMETHACDLISRQALCEYALNQKDKSVTPNDIMRFPSAQPEPKEGHWIEVAGELERSECHTVFTDLYPDYADSVACPNCGAKMKGE